LVKPRGRRLTLVSNGRQARSDPLAGLAAEALRGDRASVRTLLSTLGPHLLKITRRVLGAAHADVDDVAQECAIALISALPRRRGDSTVLHFACRIAVLTAMNVRRRERAEKRRRTRDDAMAVEALPSQLPAPDAALSARVTADLVRELLDSLPIEQAEVLGLHCVVGYAVPEIAAASGVPIETVRSRLRLAKQALRARVLVSPRLDEISEVLS
jgi:RNA polymerase sigma factor (sigma-70 family)